MVIEDPNNTIIQLLEFIGSGGLTYSIFNLYGKILEKYSEIVKKIA